MSSFITSLLMPIYIFLGMASPFAVGTSLTTINGSDTLSASRTVINDNFTALNNGKIDNSTTSLPLLTSASNLAYVGTITSGTWNGTVIGVSKGGTGTTSPTQYHIMAGGGSSGLSAISPGSAGTFLTSNGPGAYPTFQSASVDQTQAYTWTGGHFWTASSSFNSRLNVKASDTTTNALVLNGIATQWPSSDVTNGVLTSNGSGVYSLTPFTLYANGASSTINNSFSTTTITIPANTIGTNGKILFKLFGMLDGGAAANGINIQFGNGTASTTIYRMDLGAGVGSYVDVIINHEISIINSNSVTSQRYFGNIASSTTNIFRGGMAYDTTQKTYISYSLYTSHPNDNWYLDGVYATLVK